MVKLGQYRSREERAAERAARAEERETVPTFEKYAGQWLERKRVLGGRRGNLSPAGEADLAWRLGHLNGWLGGMELDAIDEREVEAFATAKRSAPLREGGLGPTSTNKCLATLEAIMRSAVRHRLVERNPVDGFRVRGAGRRTSHLETAAQVRALLDAASRIDGKGRLRHGHGRALLATLLYGGLRIDEALSLRWRDVDLGAGILRVRDGKTENAARNVEILAPLRDDLLDLRARRDEPRDALVFDTTTGGKEGATNVRRRLLARAVERANAALEDDGQELIPATLTPHSLRHTCASLLFALGWDPRRVMDRLGHADAKFTLRAYARRWAANRASSRPCARSSKDGRSRPTTRSSTQSGHPDRV
jgi:integrase